MSLHVGIQEGRGWGMWQVHITRRGFSQWIVRLCRPAKTGSYSLGRSAMCWSLRPEESVKHWLTVCLMVLMKVTSMRIAEHVTKLICCSWFVSVRMLNIHQQAINQPSHVTQVKNGSSVSTICVIILIIVCVILPSNVAWWYSCSLDIR